MSAFFQETIHLYGKTFRERDEGGGLAIALSGLGLKTLMAMRRRK